MAAATATVASAAAPPPAHGALGVTGATGGATGATGATGSTDRYSGPRDANKTGTFLLRFRYWPARNPGRQNQQAAVPRSLISRLVDRVC